jgi:hypothetical protein
MCKGQFHKYNFLYIEENLFLQLKTTYQLNSINSQTQYSESYIKLLKEYGGKIRKITSNHSQKVVVSNETLCELSGASSHLITERILLGETSDIKDKYSCPTPTLIFAAFLVAAGRATLSESAKSNKQLSEVFNLCVDYLRPLYQTHFKLSA